ncbi:MAG: TetR/AcrR family transcriptional regulator [Spirochaetaceae bacterium]|nr:TetR/AcrR family transcriptional regulator [Spirochaetaceae bacterium]
MSEEPPKNKQQERTERSTNALLEAASDLIVEGGFEALTFAAIGERSGYSRGMVSARFGNKDGLIDALIERIVTRWSHRNVIPLTKGRSGLDGAMTLLDAIKAQAAKDPRGLRVLYSLMFEAVGSTDEMVLRFAKFHEGMRADFARFVRRGQSDGSIRKGPSPEREAELLVAGLRGIGYQWLLEPGSFDPVKALAYLRVTTRERLVADTNA